MKKSNLNQSRLAMRNAAGQAIQRKISTCAVALLLPLALGSVTLARAQIGLESLIQKRQSTMWSMGSSLRNMEHMVYGLIPSDPKAFLAGAQQIDALSQQMPSLFAPETGQGKTNARPEIWTKATEFDAALKNFQEAVPVLKAAVASGDKDQIKTTVLATGRACHACHVKFVLGH